MTQMYRFPLAFALLLTSISAVQAQSDTTEYLFKKARYSYLQYHFGYHPMFFNSGQVGHGYSAEFFGIVLNDKVAVGLDFDGYVENQQAVIAQLPHIVSLVAVSLSIEPLIRPRKVINFSFPMKFGWGGAQVYGLSGTHGWVSNPQFFVVNPAAMAWINLFKPLSLGAGAGYRMCFNKQESTFQTFSGLSAFVTLRFKFYMREWQAKMMQRQAEYQRMQQPN